MPSKESLERARKYLIRRDTRFERDTYIPEARLELADLLDEAIRGAVLAEASVLGTVLEALEPYVGHSSACSHDDRSHSGGYCTCEERWAKSIVREQLDRLAQLREGKP